MYFGYYEINHKMDNNFYYYIIYNLMKSRNKINTLLCFDDKDWNYTRHAAVTILSLLETNKNNRIKIYIISSELSKENIDELKRIVKLYNQEIEFIIKENIISKELKNVIINKRENIRWPRYRYFFPKYIKWINRILYMDCDILVMNDISDIYNMNMQWKAIVWCYDRMYPYTKRNKIFWLKKYINSWVLLFDLKNYNEKKINIKKMKEINKKFSKYFRWWDQDKMNFIFNEDIGIVNNKMNYQITNQRFNRWIWNAKIIHCLEKPYIQYARVPKNLIQLYNKYLNKTKWKNYPEKKAEYWIIHHLYNYTYHFLFNLRIETRYFFYSKEQPYFDKDTLE